MALGQLQNNYSEKNKNMISLQNLCAYELAKNSVPLDNLLVGHCSLPIATMMHYFKSLDPITLRKTEQRLSLLHNCDDFSWKHPVLQYAWCLHFKTIYAEYCPSVRDYTLSKDFRVLYWEYRFKNFIPYYKDGFSELLSLTSDLQLRVLEVNNELVATQINSLAPSPLFSSLHELRILCSLGEQQLKVTLWWIIKCPVLKILSLENCTLSLSELIRVLRARTQRNLPLINLEINNSVVINSCESEMQDIIFLVKGLTIKGEVSNNHNLDYTTSVLLNPNPTTPEYNKELEYPSITKLSLSKSVITLSAFPNVTELIVVHGAMGVTELIGQISKNKMRIRVLHLDESNDNNAGISEACSVFRCKELQSTLEDLRLDINASTLCSNVSAAFAEFLTASSAQLTSLHLNMIGGDEWSLKSLTAFCSSLQRVKKLKKLMFYFDRKVLEPSLIDHGNIIIVKSIIESSAAIESLSLLESSNDGKIEIYKLLLEAAKRYCVPGIIPSHKDNRKLFQLKTLHWLGRADTNCTLYSQTLEEFRSYTLVYTTLN